VETLVVLPRSRSLRDAAVAVACALALLAVAAAEARAARPFYLRDGDRVVFYGDSITEQAHYTLPIEVFLRTRCPEMNVSFVNSGWSGDRAWGGDGGMLEERLQRDVIAHRPTVVTAMLGMNDGYYTDYDAKELRAYQDRLEALVTTLQRELPGVRITLLGSSPYDNVTPGERPDWERVIPGGYNSVVARYSAGTREVAERHQVLFVDMNRPLVDTLEQLQAADPQLARELIPDRIHPGRAAGLLMALHLLSAWNAPETVSLADVTGANAKGKVVRVEQALPLPFPIDRADPLTRILAEQSPYMQLFAGDLLRVAGLTFAKARVEIDGNPLGEFSADELNRGIDLMTVDPARRRRADEIAELVSLRNDLRFTCWRYPKLPGGEASPGVEEAKKRLAAIEDRLAKLTQTVAESEPHAIVFVGVSK
jgi:lysophospholipase L1-like esterase